MCWEDVRIGLDSVSNPVPLSVGVASAPVLGASVQRTAILFCAPNAGTVTYSPVSTAVLGQGITLSAGQGALQLDIRSYGNGIQSAWSAIASAAATGAMVVETLTRKANSGYKE